MDHLHNALDQISSWMTANLLTLNSSKTEFLLIGLSKQLAKINNSSHHHSLCSNTSLFLTRSHLSPNLAITIFASFAVSVHTSILKQLPLSPLPLFTPSLTTATLFITTCPSLRSVVDFGKLFTETNEQKFSLGGVQCKKICSHPGRNLI